MGIQLRRGRPATRPAVELPETDSWHKLPGERHHDHLTTFIALGPGRRLPALAEATGINLNTIKDWAARWRWLDRAEAWDQSEVIQARVQRLAEEEFRRRDVMTVAKETRDLMLDGLDPERMTMKDRSAEARGWIDKELLAAGITGGPSAGAAPTVAIAIDNSTTVLGASTQELLDRAHRLAAAAPAHLSGDLLAFAAALLADDERVILGEIVA